MTKVIPILFMLGFIWAALLLLPALSFFAGDHNVLSLAALAGFWVWFGWGWHCLTGRFPLVSARTFWSISLIVHLVWLGGITWDGFELNSGIFIWTVTNVIVAFVGLLPESGGNGWKHKVASMAAYGLPLVFAGALVVIYLREGQSRFSEPDAWLFVVVVIALIATARLNRVKRTRNGMQAKPS